MQREVGTIFPSVPTPQQASGDRILWSTLHWVYWEILLQWVLQYLIHWWKQKTGLLFFLWRQGRPTTMTSVTLDINDISDSCIHLLPDIFLCSIFLAGWSPWQRGTLLGACRVQGPKDKSRILPIMVPEREGSRAVQVQSTGPKSLCCLVPAIVCLGVTFRGRLYCYLCSRHLSLQFSFHWLFDFKAIHIASQSVLKIGFLAKNGTGITHFLLGSHLRLGCHTSSCSNHPQLCASVRRFWTFAILWKLPLFFLSCANTVQWLISFHIPGAHLFADCILTT